MPYDIRKIDGQYHVINQQTGEDKGVSKSRAMAEKHMAALYSAEPRQMSSPGMKMGGVTGMTVNDSYEPTPITHAYMNGKKYPVMQPESGDKELKALHAEHKNPAPSAGKQHGEEKPPPTMMIPEGATSVTPGMLGGGILARINGKKKKPAEGSPAEERGESKATEAKEIAAGIDKPKLRSGGVLQRISKNMKKGGLHESLGVPEGQKIPASEVAAAAKRPGKVGAQARLAETFAKFRH